MEYVNSPAHYNQHPSGMECIVVIRHYASDIANALKYLWRAGLKPEMGKSDIEKELEDLDKAVWYIVDYMNNCSTFGIVVSGVEIQTEFRKYIGCDMSVITDGYQSEHVRTAVGNLLYVGFIGRDKVVTHSMWRMLLKRAKSAVEYRKEELLNK